MFFHGGLGTAKHAASAYGWNEKADKEGFLVAYPNGTGAIQTWNAMHGCGSAFKSSVDDVGFVKALIEDLNAKKVTASDANKVKGGFNPQPDPPAKSDRGKGA